MRQACEGLPHLWVRNTTYTWKPVGVGSKHRTTLQGRGATDNATMVNPPAASNVFLHPSLCGLPQTNAGITPSQSSGQDCYLAALLAKAMLTHLPKEDGILGYTLRSRLNTPHCFKYIGHQCSQRSVLGGIWEFLITKESRGRMGNLE